MTEEEVKNEEVPAEEQPAEGAEGEERSWSEHISFKVNVLLRGKRKEAIQARHYLTMCGYQNFIAHVCVICFTASALLVNKTSAAVAKTRQAH